jgi:hypothetical protein
MYIWVLLASSEERQMYLRSLAGLFGQIVFAYNLFETLKRKATQEEVQGLETS